VYARIRGIYSTAITKLLLEHGIKVTQPTKPIVERFKLETPTYCPPDVTIKDLEDKRGVLVIGLPKAVEKVVQTLLDRLEQVLVKKYWPLLYSLYKGIVKEVRPNGQVLVDIGDTVGILQDSIPGLREGDELTVCVRKPSFDGFPKLSTRLVVSGKYVKFISGEEKVTMSEYIRDPLKREELFSLGFMVRPRGWGVRWRSSAGYASAEELLEEVENLKKRVKELETKIREKSAPSLIETGEAIVELIFTLKSKKTLDQFRRSVISTVDYHHYLKSIEGFSERVDFVEYLLSKGVNRETLSEALLEYHVKTMIKRGKGTTLHHLMINGKMVKIHGTVYNTIENGIIMSRRFSPGGYYDGIGEKKERGDYGLTLIKLFRPYVIHFYYNKDSVLKGIYFNVNTPVELVSTNTFRYIDLEVDVVKSSSGVKVIDYDAFERYVKRGVIPDNYAKKVENLVENVRALLEEDFKTPLELEEKLSKTLCINESLDW